MWLPQLSEKLGDTRALLRDFLNFNVKFESKKIKMIAW